MSTSNHSSRCSFRVDNKETVHGFGGFSPIFEHGWPCSYHELYFFSNTAILCLFNCISDHIWPSAMITLCVPNTQVKQICAQQLFCCAQIGTTKWHIKIWAQICTKKKRSKIFSSNLKSHSGVFNQCFQAKKRASHTATLNIFLPDLRRINRFTIEIQHQHPLDTLLFVTSPCLAKVVRARTPPPHH